MNMRGISRRLRRLEKSIGDGKITHVFAVLEDDGTYRCDCSSERGRSEVYFATRTELDAWRKSGTIAGASVLIDDVGPEYL
jgi:hypothetical protein